jgi:uncharacterized protein (DUF2236 family)
VNGCCSFQPTPPVVGWVFLRPCSEFAVRVYDGSMPRHVSAADLDALLAQLSASVATPELGLFGPDSVSWKINRESALFLGAGRAALLQLAHPWVAAAIAQHSRTLDDPISRFHHTFRVIFAMIFGSAEQAFVASRRLHRLHESIQGALPDTAGRFEQGSQYEANELSALVWVYATLVDSAVIAYELLLPSLGQADRERYFNESLRMAALFGIPRDALPNDWSGFRSYFDITLKSDALGVSAATRGLARKLQSGAGLLVKPPFWFEALTLQMLPPHVREQFGFTFGSREQAAAARAIRLLRPVYRRLPRAIRFVGPYNEAHDRMRGSRPGLAVRLSNRLWIGQSTLLACSP